MSRSAPRPPTTRHRPVASQQTRGGRLGTPSSAAGAPGDDAAAAPPLDASEHTEFIRQIGSGGFGQVWLVRYFGRLEAWKMIPRSSGNVEAAVKEVLHARAVNHPHVVNLIDIRDELEKRFLVLRMQYVEGRDLHHVVQEQGLRTVSECLRMAREVAEVLEAAHHQGVIHLDLKPQNLILEQASNAVHVTDFGIATSVMKQLGRRSSDLAGTPSFMAPEQYRDSEVLGPDTDVWALGVTLHYLLGGDLPPIPAGDDEAPATPDWAALRRHCPWVPEELVRLVERMVLPERDQRISSMSEVLTRVRELEGNRPLADAEDAFARGEYRLARELLAVRAEDPDLSADVLERARALTAAITEFEKELWTGLDGIDQHLAEDRLLEALQETDGMPTRFSRCEELHGRRERLIGRVIQVWESTNDYVRDRLRHVSFAEARARLGAIQRFLDDPHARSILLAEERTDLDLLALSTTVDEAQRAFAKLHDEIDQAINQLDFSAALRHTEELYVRFTSLRDPARLETLGQAVNSIEYLEDYDEEALGTFDADPVPSLAHGSLKRAVDCCGMLLQAFDPAQYPGLERIEKLREVLEASMARARARVTRALEDAEKFQQTKHHAEAARVLSRVRALVDGTDLFDVNLRQHFRTTHHKVSSLADNAERSYDEGRRLFEERRYQLALQHLERVAALAPELHHDLDELRSACRERLGDQDVLEEELPNLVACLKGPEIRVDDLMRLLDIAPKLHELRDADGRQRLLGDLIATLHNYLGILQRETGGVPGKDSALSVLDELSTVLAALEPGLLRSAIEHSAPLATTLGEILERCFGAVHSAADMQGIGDKTQFLESCVERLERARENLVMLGADKDGFHPTLTLAALAGEIHRNEGPHMPRELEARCMELVGRLSSWYPARTGARIRRHADRMRSRRRSWETATLLRSGVRRAAVIGIPTVLLLVAFLGGEWFGRGRGRAAERGDHVSAVLAALRLDGRRNFEVMSRFAEQRPEDFGRAVALLDLRSAARPAPDLPHAPERGSVEFGRNLACLTELPGLLPEDLDSTADFRSEVLGHVAVLAQESVGRLLARYDAREVGPDHDAMVQAESLYRDLRSGLEPLVALGRVPATELEAVRSELEHSALRVETTIHELERLLAVIRDQTASESAIERAEQFERIWRGLEGLLFREAGNPDPSTLERSELLGSLLRSYSCAALLEGYEEMRTWVAASENPTLLRQSLPLLQCVIDALVQTRNRDPRCLARIEEGRWAEPDAPLGTLWRGLTGD